jgi:FkbM family methyltransferase
VVAILRAAMAATLRAAAATRPTERLATRAAHSGLATIVAGAGTVEVRRLGTSFTLDLADNVQRTLFLTGRYEPDFLRFLKSELRVGDVYADIGAHVGIDAIVAARRVGVSGHVYAFEPAPDTSARLAEVTRSSGNVTVVNVALGAARTMVALRSDPSFGTGDASARSLFTDGSVICQVPMTTFDAWAVDLDRLDVAKIDIEGGEHDAIVGMRATLSRLRPRAIVVELQASRLRLAGHTEEDVTRLLLESEYLPSGESFLENVVFRRRESQTTQT